ncbi:MAG: Rrf2 family transcriptional regulator [Ferruginibacter sp.]|nr:Rrf2 family transcriptional regulator [Cytophagales bacterium]
MLSKKAKYAIKALITLARKPERGSMGIGEIAEEERIPRKFLEAILLDLKNQGILYSKRGKAGGYALLKSPSEISIGLIIRVIDGPLAQVPCASKTAYQPCLECKDAPTCSIRLVMIKVRDATADILDNTSLRDVIDSESELLYVI